MNTARFAQLVAACGTPEPYTLWLPPAKDPAFQKALKAQRVLTVHHANTGSKADHGTVGFDEGEAKEHPELLLFPKALKAFAGKRIVGLNYELVKQPEVVPATRGGRFEKSALRRMPPVPAAAAPVAPAATSAKGAASPPPTPAPPTATLADDHRHPDRGRGSEGRGTPPAWSPRTSARAAEAKMPLKETRRAVAPAPASSPELARVLLEVRRAVRELAQGKAVAAHQRLQNLLAAPPR